MKYGQGKVTDEILGVCLCFLLDVNFLLIGEPDEVPRAPGCLNTSFLCRFLELIEGNVFTARHLLL